MNSKKTDRWLQRKQRIRNSATVDGRALADEFCAEGRALGFECEHIIAINRGGPHTRGNTAWLTKAENRAKSDNLVPTMRNGIVCVPYLTKRQQQEIDLDGREWEEVIESWQTEA